MRSSRMAIVLSLCFAASSVAASPPRAGAAAAAPPDGSYAYAVSRAGTIAGTSSVTVKRSGMSVTVDESETFGKITETVAESLDQGDLSPTSYVSSFPVSSDVTATARLEFYAGGARVTLDTVPGSTDFKVASGTTKLVVVDGALATGFLFLPAQLKAQSLSAFTLLAPSSMTTFSCSTNGTAAPQRPAGLPAPDVSTTIDCTAPNGGTGFVLWYDPQSFVVDEIDVPTQQVTIARVPTQHQ